MTSKKRWSSAENQELKRCFALGMTDEQIQTHLPLRAVRAIQQQRIKVGAVYHNIKRKRKADPATKSPLFEQKQPAQRKRSANAVKQAGQPFIATAYPAPDKVAAVYHTTVLVLVGVVALLAGYVLFN